MQPKYPKPVLLVLAYGDVQPDGSLEPACIARLTCVLEYAREHHCAIMVAAGNSRRRQGKSPMSAAMSLWLQAQGFYDIIEQTSPVFNTRGELWVFAGYPGAFAICSDADHLRRVRELIREMVGPEAVAYFQYVVAPSDGKPLRSRVLEPLKWLAIWLPWWIRIPFVNLLWRFRLNTS